MLSKKFESADRLFFHDKFLAKTILKLFPGKVTPNMVTTFRLIATPVVAFLMLYQHYSIGLITFLVVAFTDMIDGSLARTRNQITEWGKVCDPLADKILIALMIFIIVLRYISIWTAGIIVGLEVVIIFSAWREKMEGKEVQANFWGKIKMLELKNILTYLKTKH